MKIVLRQKVKIGKRIDVGDNFNLKTKLLKPVSKDALRRYIFEVRTNDLSKYRFYSDQVSPGVVRFQFAEVK